MPRNGDLSTSGGPLASLHQPEGIKMGIRSLLPLALLATTHCGGGAPEPAAPTSEPVADPPAADPATMPEAEPEAPAVEAPAAWADDLSMDQKKAFMQAKVMPKMKALFEGMSAEHYADFSCKTCHGPEWKKPKDFLPTLEMKDGKFTAAKDKPQVVEFMMQKVTPEMAGIFGQPPFDPKTGKGFGCGGCHTVKM